MNNLTQSYKRRLILEWLSKKDEIEAIKERLIDLQEHVDGLQELIRGDCIGFELGYRGDYCKVIENDNEIELQIVKGDRHD